MDIRVNAPEVWVAGIVAAVDQQSIERLARREVTDVGVQRTHMRAAKRGEIE